MGPRPSRRTRFLYERRMREMKDDLLKKIRTLFSTHTGLSGQPATDTEITDTEIQLNIKFNEQYVEFIKRFGGAFGGIDIHAFNNGALIGKATVTEMTEKFRSIYTDNLPEELVSAIVISDDDSGNSILINTAGEIFIYLHEEDVVEILYDLLNALLTKFFP